MRIQDQVAIVTGAGSGIGRATALLFAQEGALLVLNDIDAQGLESTRAQAGTEKCRTVLGSVAQEETAVRLAREAMSAFGRIDVLVNNAGSSWGAPAEEMRLEDWNKVIETNLTGTFLFAQAVGKKMIQQGRGKIINIASVAGLQGAPSQLDAIGYHASKGGVISFTKDLACKWAKHNIQVNAIAPGWFPTHMSHAVLEHHREFFLERIPLRRFGSGHDLKGAVVFLASDASDYVTGHVLVVDGGQSAW